MARQAGFFDVEDRLPAGSKCAAVQFAAATPATINRGTIRVRGYRRECGSRRDLGVESDRACRAQGTRDLRNFCFSAWGPHFLCVVSLPSAQYAMVRCKFAIPYPRRAGIRVSTRNVARRQGRAQQTPCLTSCRQASSYSLAQESSAISPTRRRGSVCPFSMIAGTARRRRYL